MNTYRIKLLKGVITKILIGSRNFLIHQNEVNVSPAMSLVQNTTAVAPLGIKCGLGLHFEEIQSWTGLQSKVDLYMIAPNSDAEILLIVYEGTLDPGVTIVAQLPEA